MWNWKIDIHWVLEVYVKVIATDNIADLLKRHKRRKEIFITLTILSNITWTLDIGSGVYGQILTWSIRLKFWLAHCGIPKECRCRYVKYANPTTFLHVDLINWRPPYKGTLGYSDNCSHFSGHFPLDMAFTTE